MMGNKIEAKNIMHKNNVPTVPGIKDIEDKNKIESFIKKEGLPIIIKAASGGGGKGMRIVNKIEDIKIWPKVITLIITVI